MMVFAPKHVGAVFMKILILLFKAILLCISWWKNFDDTSCFCISADSFWIRYLTLLLQKWTIPTSFLDCPPSIQVASSKAHGLITISANTGRLLEMQYGNTPCRRPPAFSLSVLELFIVRLCRFVHASSLRFKRLIFLSLYAGWLVSRYLQSLASYVELSGNTLLYKTYRATGTVSSRLYISPRDKCEQLHLHS